MKRKFPMDFIIFYEHLNRELENVLLIKHELETRGYSVAISHFSGCSYGRHVLFSRPEVIVTPWLRYDENVYRFTRFRGSTKKIVNLQWEQIYSKKGIESGLVTISGTAKQAYHICWGAKTKSRLIQQGISPDKLEITGAVQLDFGRPDFDYYYQSREEISQEFDLNPSLPWILYISSFAYATYNPNAIKTLECNFNTSLSQLVDVSKKSKDITLKWIDELLAVNRNIIFIYRPHPSENIDKSLMDMSKKHQTFKIISANTVKQWIKVCDIINTWFSTSVAEVYFMGKICHIIRPIYVPEDIEVEIMRHAKFITDKEEFIAVNTNMGQVEYNFPVPVKILRRYYDYDEQKPSFVRVADFLEKVYLSNQAENFALPMDDIVKFQRKYKKEIMASLITDFIAKTRIKLSKVVPYKRSSFCYYERWIEWLNIYKHMENRLLTYICDRNEK
jgi:surface carbohydrate biosynthesis protein